jgi:hypothetical protein
MSAKWLYEGLFIDEMPDKEAHGFTYKITYIDPETNEVKCYYGKKNFYSVTNPKKGKKELSAMEDKRGSKRKKVIKESNWLKYKSSHSFLKNVEDAYIQKEMLTICYSKMELTYQETRELFVNSVLEDENCFNDNILGRFYKSK